MTTSDKLYVIPKVKQGPSAEDLFTAFRYQYRIRFKDALFFKFIPGKPTQVVKNFKPGLEMEEVCITELEKDHFLEVENIVSITYRGGDIWKFIIHGYTTTSPILVRDLSTSRHVQVEITYNINSRLGELTFISVL